MQIDSTVTISGDPEGETTAAEELRVELNPALIPKNLGDEIYDVIHFKDAVTGETLDRVLVRTTIRTLAPIEMPTVTPEVLDFEIPDSGNEPICRSFSVFGKSLSAISWRTHEGFVFHAQHAQLFDDKAIYGFDIRHMPDLVPINALFPKGGTGAAGFAKPDLPKYAGENGRVKIFVLDTDRSLDENRRHVSHASQFVARYLVDRQLLPA